MPRIDWVVEPPCAAQAGRPTEKKKKPQFLLVIRVKSSSFGASGRTGKPVDDEKSSAMVVGFGLLTIRDDLVH